MSSAVSWEQGVWVAISVDQEHDSTSEGKDVMKKNKCLICLKVKGKRRCKITQDALICSQCCAAIRKSDCGSCSHYIQSERYAVEKSKKSGFKHFMAMIDPEVDDAVDKALEYAEKGNVRKGEELMVRLLKEHPNLHIVHYGMGTVLAMKGNYKESIVYFDNCLEIFPYFTEAWFNKGVAHKNLLDINGALTSFQKVVELGDEDEDFVKSTRELLNDMDADIYRDTGLSLELYIQSMEEFDRSFTCMRNRKYEEAIIGFNNVLKLNNNHTQSYGNIGLCHAFLGNRQEALSAFDRALEIDPTYQPAIDNRKIFLSLKEGEAMKDMNVAVVEYYKDVINKEPME
ncbi:tetratricopeptide repeat protein [Desulfobulbus alkaliphilus]|uniref:tetratricopeptide repeat protein n=1 Tax=Desulfobulbus alkaliphilus TaxID=869814 RepID=UPI001965A801|nr:tetratricopeptide repeat protein [Desulfobulbus alkaliphilus]MBM9537110.1 tetratricopeptide repeat protein [Desulfobulbus alkaliphilus]